jgi:hypothetical protein
MTTPILIPDDPTPEQVEMLKQMDLDAPLHWPFLTPEEAQRLQIERAKDIRAALAKVGQVHPQDRNED